MSATMDVARIQAFFDFAPIITIPGRAHQVTIFHLLQPTEDYLLTAVRTALLVHWGSGPGDILVFVASQDQCDHAVRSIAEENSRLRGGLCWPFPSTPPSLDTSKRLRSPRAKTASGRWW